MSSGNIGPSVFSCAFPTVSCICSRLHSLQAEVGSLLRPLCGNRAIKEWCDHVNEVYSFNGSPHTTPRDCLQQLVSQIGFAEPGPVEDMDDSESDPDSLHEVSDDEELPKKKGKFF